MENIEKQYGKIIQEFDTFYHCWDMDAKGYICESENGEKKIILTDHNIPYIAAEKEVLGMIKNIEQLSGKLKEVLAVVKNN